MIGVLRVTVTALVLLAVPGEHAAHGQTAAAPRVEAPGELTLELARETVLPIRIEAGGPAPRTAMLLIYGLPEHVSLTGGRLFESGVWAIPAADVGRTRLATRQDAPPGQTSQLSITLLSLVGTVLAEARMRLVIGGGAEAAIVTRSTASQIQPSAAEAGFPVTEALPQPVLRISVEEEALRLKRGEEALALSDVTAARLVFEHLAALGSAAAAFKLGQTYDAQVIAGLAGGAMIRPDAESAARWYAKAAGMGHAEAREKIAGSE